MTRIGYAKPQVFIITLEALDTTANRGFPTVDHPLLGFSRLQGFRLHTTG